MRWFPEYWRGTHPAFPQNGDDSFDPGLPAIPLKAGLWGGAIAATLALFNRYVPGQLVKIIGASGVIAAGSQVYQTAIVERALVKRDVFPILEADGVPLPKYKLWERTTAWTLDDAMLLGFVLGLARGLVPPRLKYSLFRGRPVLKLSRLDQSLRLFGCGFVGGSIPLLVPAVKLQWRSNDGKVEWVKQNFDEKSKYVAELEHAKALYEAKSGRQPPAWLYDSVIARLTGTFPEDGQMSGESTDSPFPTELGAFPDDEGAEQHHSADARLLPRGTAPHGAVLVEGGVAYLPQTDYHWTPASAAEGIESLEEHIKDVSSSRAEKVKDAQYVWQVLAKRERELAALPPDDSDARRILIAKLELLNTAHKIAFMAIAEHDWVLQDSRKRILQLRSGGIWTPPAAADELKTHAPHTALKLMKRHLVELKHRRAHIRAEMEEMSPEKRQLVDDTDIMRALDVNDAATEELIKEFEERCADPGAFDDSVD